jgi:hypothetical protein
MIEPRKSTRTKLEAHCIEQNIINRYRKELLTTALSGDEIVALVLGYTGLDHYENDHRPDDEIIASVVKDLETELGIEETK